MGSLSMTASDLHTKYHRPPDRSSDLLGDRAQLITELTLHGRDCGRNFSPRSARQDYLSLCSEATPDRSVREYELPVLKFCNAYGEWGLYRQLIHGRSFERNLK